jgi:hypothetical protein
MGNYSRIPAIFYYYNHSALFPLYGQKRYVFSREKLRNKSKPVDFPFIGLNLKITL